jgi:glycine cleavage system H protein
MNLPEDLRYTSDHEWVRVEGGRARVGITDFAQDALGDVVFVQLPEVGASVAAGESCGEVESTKSVSDVFAPLNGTVVQINDDLGESPERLNNDPYGDGWLYVLELGEGADPSSLLDAAAYRALVDEQ